ncbi:hypothetical protein K402DRAFT_417866 [Aulographum hederae CBS 113979]|uniref:Superoxide dismutase copper/zinc binding domain-containing protein n=1 Tax=Aulographum hederae CBS 113979 TaxID=1176131 RepID=A0A6G1HBN7_9PEZI|nr:hypothetical protein K402DRAFT_417866 [Aulographum hederae CBS 113979]
MCNGHSTRTSQGGTIAVLRPICPRYFPGGSDNEPQSRTEQLNGSLFFQNGLANLHTQAVFRGDNLQSNRTFHNCFAVIHKYGDNDKFHPLHQLDMRRESIPSDDGRTSEFTVGKALDLTVGENGVIGRRITVHRMGNLSSPIAEGIIGWN